MKVTPIKKKFGKYDVGQVFELPDRAARIFIKAKKVSEVSEAAPTYQTRMMTAEIPSPEPQQARGTTVKLSEAQALSDAPFGYKADGTPRKRAAPKPKASE